MEVLQVCGAKTNTPHIFTLLYIRSLAVALFSQIKSLKRLGLIEYRNNKKSLL